MKLKSPGVRVVVEGTRGFARISCKTFPKFQTLEKLAEKEKATSIEVAFSFSAWLTNLTYQLIMNLFLRMIIQKLV